MSMNGWLIIDKPVGMTSTRVGSILKRICHTKRIGHVGTLDPFATGVLPIAIGEATKIIPYVDTDVKEYEFELTFGEARDTYDVEGEIVATSDVRPTVAAIEKALGQFRGQITQIPPAYSAVRVNGERAYELARQGIVPKIKARQVTIYKLELVQEKLPDVVILRVLCSSGTYVRTLGSDLAKTLGTVGYLTMLRRTKVGNFTLKSAFLLDNLKEKAHSSNVPSCILPIRAVLDDIPAVSVSQDEEQRIRLGQAIPASVDLPESSICLLLAEGGEVSLAKVREKNLSPIRVFNFSR